VDVGVGPPALVADHPLVVEPDDEVHVQVGGHPGDLGEALGHVPAVPVEDEDFGVGEQPADAGQQPGVFRRLLAETGDALLF
jgi:hypothetical protein